MQFAADPAETVAAVRTDLAAIFVSLELSRSKWLVTSLSPGAGEKMSKFVVSGRDNRNALKTGNGNRWTRERVTSIRSNYRIPVFKPAADGVEPWLNLTGAARLLKVSTRTLRLAAEAGEIEAIHPLPDAPWVFARTAVATDAAQSITARARQNPKYPAGSPPAQQNLFTSIT